MQNDCCDYTKHILTTQVEKPKSSNEFNNYKKISGNSSPGRMTFYSPRLETKAVKLIMKITRRPLHYPSRVRSSLLLLGLLLALVSSPLAVQAANSSGQQLWRGQDYAFWQFPAPGDNFWNIDQSVLISEKGHHTFWALQTGFTGSQDAGYIGLQTDGNRFDGTVGELAIFSLWNSNGAYGPSCGVFGGEGTGHSCRINFELKAGEWYRYRIWRLNADSAGQWWGGWIIDSAGAEHFIGAIREPFPGHQYLNSVLNFREYFGPTLPCDQQPQSLATFEAPAANYHGGNSGSYEYYSQPGGVGKGGCSQS